MTSQTHPSITIETVTPEMAARLLGTMEGNRPLRQRAVQRYAREMLAGKWAVNGEAIKIARTGRLIDGQHRLSAVMMAKIPVQMCVVRGVDDSAIITLDTGVGRSFYDVGVIGGQSYAQAVGPIIRWWFKYLSGSPSVSNYPTHQEMAQVLVDHPQITESAAFIAKLKVVKSRCGAGVQGFVHSYASEAYDRDMADLFMNDLNEGAQLPADSPIFALRRRLVDITPESKGRMDQSHVLAWTIKAWNAWVAGEKMKAVKWQSSGDKTEPFPRFKNEVSPPNPLRLVKPKKRAKA